MHVKRNERDHGFATGGSAEKSLGRRLVDTRALEILTVGCFHVGFLFVWHISERFIFMILKRDLFPRDLFL